MQISCKIAPDAQNRVGLGFTQNEAEAAEVRKLAAAHMKSVCCSRVSYHTVVCVVLTLISPLRCSSLNFLGEKSQQLAIFYCLLSLV